MDRITHFEIPADDLGRAKKFYTNIFGWKAVDMPESDYVLVHTGETDEKGMLKTPGTINGGIMKRNAPNESPVFIISVESIDETLRKIQSAGCKIVMPKTQVGEMGLYARCTDPEGNVIGVWQDLRKE